LKVDQHVRETMRNLLKSGYVFDNKVLLEMQRLEWSKNAFGINYPFLKPCLNDKDISSQIREGGYLRYWKEIKKI
jgi:hypothetical protein